MASVTGRQMIKVLERQGFHVARIVGSHHMMRKAGHSTIVPVPVHGRQPLAAGTLASILRQAGISKKQLLNLLGR